MSVRIVLEPEMVSVCREGAVICFQVKSASADEKGNVVVDADAVIFDTVPGRVGEADEKLLPVMESKPVIEPAVLDPIVSADADFLDLTQPSPEESPSPVGAAQEAEAAVVGGADEFIDLSPSVPEPVPVAVPQPSAPVEPVQPSADEPVSLFGIRGPALLGEEPAKISAIHEESSVKAAVCETVSDKERFYELLSAVDTSSVTQGKQTDGPLSREQAVALEKEGGIRTGFSAYARNKAKGKLCIGDLGLSVPFGGVLNLGRMSADKLKSSSELYELLNAGVLEFVQENEAKEIAEKAAKRARDLVMIGGEETYDSLEEAEVGRRIDRRRSKTARNRPFRKIGEGGDDGYGDDGYGDDGYGDDDSGDGGYDIMAGDRNAVNMVPGRLRDPNLYVRPDSRNELDMVQGDIDGGVRRFVEDL